MHNAEYTRLKQANQKHNTICFGHHYTQANTNNVNRTWVDASARELVNPECIIRPVFSVSALTCFFLNVYIIDIYSS